VTGRLARFARVGTLARVRPPAEDIFDPIECAALLERLARIRENQKPLWGKMSAAQMFAHCQAPLEVALGDKVLKRGLVGILFGGIARRQLLKPKPFGRNMPTAPEFLVRDWRDAERERVKLIELAQRLSSGGPAVLTTEPHPFFGALTAEEWSRLQWKHLDHHLRQFGA
jgi:hypothetical protein